jgi:hypothetical protein
MCLEMGGKASAQAMSDMLLQYALDNGTTDNVSVMVVQMSSKWDSEWEDGVVEHTESKNATWSQIHSGMNSDDESEGEAVYVSGLSNFAEMAAEALDESISSGSGSDSESGSFTSSGSSSGNANGNRFDSSSDGSGSETGTLSLTDTGTRSDTGSLSDMRT